MRGARRPIATCHKCVHFLVCVLWLFDWKAVYFSCARSLGLVSLLQTDMAAVCILEATIAGAPVQQAA
jgi:hypothetical protein